MVVRQRFPGSGEDVLTAHEPDAGDLEGFAGAVDECLDRVVSAQDTAGDGLDEFGFGGGASGGPGVTGGPVDDEAHQARDEDVQDQGQQMVRLVNMDRVQRFDEQEIESDP